MSLFNSFDRTRHLNELAEPLETQGAGVLTPAQRRALVQANIGIGSDVISGSVLTSSPTAGFGYSAGAGDAVTQATDRTTAVVISTLAGQITTHNASLAAEASANFTVTNTAIDIGDVVAVSIQSGSNGGNTAVSVVTVADGSFVLKVSNNNAAGGTAETGAIIINYAVIKSVAA